VKPANVLALATSFDSCADWARVLHEAVAVFFYRPPRWVKAEDTHALNVAAVVDRA